MDIVFPSMIDPNMAPPGKDVASIFVQYAPYHIDGGWNDAKREAFGDAVIDTLSAYAPNLKAAIVGRQVITPADIEQKIGLSEGNIFQGELALQQLFFQRPALRWSGYRTPIHGYYHCGASTHPGGGVMGAAGRLAALRILGDGNAPRASGAGA
jgi:phytoene dehydrogenase-like protein